MATKKYDSTNTPYDIHLWGKWITVDFTANGGTMDVARKNADGDYTAIITKSADEIFTLRDMSGDFRFTVTGSGEFNT